MTRWRKETEAVTYSFQCSRRQYLDEGESLACSCVWYELVLHGPLKDCPVGHFDGPDSRTIYEPHGHCLVEQNWKRNKYIIAPDSKHSRCPLEFLNGLKSHQHLDLNYHFISSTQSCESMNVCFLKLLRL